MSAVNTNRRRIYGLAGGLAVILMACTAFGPLASGASQGPMRAAALIVTALLLAGVAALIRRPVAWSKFIFLAFGAVWLQTGLLLSLFGPMKAAAPIVFCAIAMLALGVAQWVLDRRAA